MSDPGPHCLIWLPLYHRVAAVESGKNHNIFNLLFISYILFYYKIIFSVTHPIMCDACHRENFAGFRYRCQKCNSYQLCQDCFWRGKVSGTHNNDHETREYSSFVSNINYNQYFNLKVKVIN